MTKTIKIVSTLGSVQTIETNATTFGELTPVLQSKGIRPSDLTLLVEGSNVELSHPNALLPEGNFNLFAFPKKTKSGIIENDLSQINSTLIYISEQIEELNKILSEKEIPTYTSTSTQPVQQINEEDQELLRKAQSLLNSLNQEEQDIDVENYF